MDEYTCSEGSCISLSKRCDLKVDCPDSSDEIGCDKLMLPSEYLPELPPPGSVENTPLRVNISIVVKGFAKVRIDYLPFNLPCYSTAI